MLRAGRGTYDKRVSLAAGCTMSSSLASWKSPRSVATAAPADAVVMVAIILGAQGMLIIFWNLLVFFTGELIFICTSDYTNPDI